MKRQLAKVQLTFPGFRPGPVGLVANKTLSSEQWQSAGEALATVEGRLMWYIGDWLNAGEHHGYLERGKLDEACELFGIDYNTAAHAVSVSKAIEQSCRRRQLSFTHHAEVANRDDAAELLDWCEETGASVAELRAEKRARAKAAAIENAGNIPSGKYNVIYADPPWEYRDKCEEGAVQAGGCERHYTTMSLDELCSLDIPSADDAVLFLWATTPLLPDALTVCTSWGFEYRTNFVWDKVKHNMGHYSSVRHEHLLICVKGSFVPQQPKLHDSVQVVERNGHSEKPEVFRNIIESLYPSARKIELFARKNVEGWTTWGTQGE